MTALPSTLLRVCDRAGKGTKSRKGARGELKSEGEFQSKADVALFGSEEVKINGIGQSLKKIILDLSVVFVGGVDGAVDGAGVEANSIKPRTAPSTCWSSSKASIVAQMKSPLRRKATRPSL